MKLAVTDLAAFIVTVQVPVPEQAPPQPVKAEPMDSVAVSVTDVLLVKAAEQIEPQLMPAGMLVTVPLPRPVLVTDNEYRIGVGVGGMGVGVGVGGAMVPYHL